MQKVVIVTGASSGIGLATANLLCEKGYKVYGIARNEYPSNKFKCFQGDVNDTKRIEEILSEIYSQNGRIDALINNAGMGIAGGIEYASGEMIDKIFNTNLISLVKICSIAIKYLKESRGRIINTSSVAGVLPIPFQACYTATKAGVLKFSMALDNEVNRFGVRVSAILPGDTKTGFTSARVIEGKEDAYNGSISKSIKRMEKDEQTGVSPIVVGKAMLKILESKKPPLKYIVGGNYKFLVFITRFMPVKLVNYILKKMYA